MRISHILPGTSELLMLLELFPFSATSSLTTFTTFQYLLRLSLSATLVHRWSIHQDPSPSLMSS